MSSLAEIHSQIEKLQKQADQIKAREFDKKVQEILAMMETFGITAKDLASSKSIGKKSTLKKGNSTNSRGTHKKSNSKVAVKYRAPTGETWSGRGLTPRWLVALIGQGKTKEEFAVKN